MVRLMRLMKRVFGAAAICACFQAAAAQPGPLRPIVVELYTSQGCSSCVPADVLLAKLVKRKDVLALSLPVNYWDILGWKDTLAHDADAKRQKSYATLRGRGGVYTPQMIVDGTADVVGNRQDQVSAAIGAARAAATSCDGLLPEVAGKHHAELSEACTAPIELKRAKEGLQISVGEAVGLRKTKFLAKVWLFALRRKVTVAVGGGENNGRTLTYSNVVDKIKTLGMWDGFPAAFTLAYDGTLVTPQSDFAVVVQQNGYGRVVGAAIFPAPGR
jgi:hypothetical protein